MLATADTTDLDHGPRAKPGTVRMCVVTRQSKSIDDLIRFVLSPSGEVVPDVRRKLPGRGLWISVSKQAVEDAARRSLFAKSFKTGVTCPPALADLTDALLARSALDALAMAGKAGEVITGFAKVEAAIGGGRVEALIHAADGSDDGIRKLDAKWTAVAAQTAKTPEFSAIKAFTTDELDLALGRSNVVHAALLAGPATKTFLTRWHTLERFRHPEGEADGKTEQGNRASRRTE